MPLLKSSAKALKPHVKNFALSTASDLLEGKKNFKNIIKTRGIENIKRAGKDIFTSQKGKGLRNRRVGKQANTSMYNRLGLGPHKIKIYRKKATPKKRKVKRKKKAKVVQTGKGRKRKTTRKKGKAKRRKRRRNLSTKSSIFD